MSDSALPRVVKTLGIHEEDIAVAFHPCHIPSMPNPHQPDHMVGAGSQRR
ncbi:MAG: hypothetical protein ACLVJO_04840 [[Clostridium] scindens]